MTDLSRGPYRVEFECEVTVPGPIRVGTGERLSIDTDAPLLRDRSGHPWIPGSSIRGVLRDWAEREAPPCGIDRRVVDSLFGAAPPRARRAKKNAPAPPHRQGRLTVLDLAVERASTRVRDHVAIDRDRGAAAEGGKFDQEVAEQLEGTLRLVYEGVSAGDEELRLLRRVLDAFRAGWLPLGGKTGWGFGAVEVGDVTARAQPRGDCAGLSGYLQGRLGRKVNTEAVELPALAEPASSRRPRASEPEAWSCAVISFEMQFDGPMLVADPARRDIPPEMAEADDVYMAAIREGQPILPGSSLRGVVSAYARRIWHSLQPGPNQPQIDGLALPDLLFGSKKPSTSEGTQGRRGLLRVGEGAHVEPVATVYLTHVAIDRVTGFAADQKLFSTAALASPRFRSTLAVRWRRHEGAAVALLLMVLRDMGQGLLWAGSRTTRGYGHLQSTSTIEVAVSRVVTTNGLPQRQRASRLVVNRIAEAASLFTPELDAWTRLFPTPGGA